MATAALGITVHTGWAACVIVGGSPAQPQVGANEIIDVVAGEERFCYHLAAQMEPAAAEAWIARLREKALASARRQISRMVTPDVQACAIVAKHGDAGNLAEVLASHPRIHTAEACFYRDVFREASTLRVQVVPPRSLDVSKVGKLAKPPWGRDQKLAALAAWTVLRG